MDYDNDPTTIACPVCKGSGQPSHLIRLEGEELDCSHCGGCGEVDATDYLNPAR